MIDDSGARTSARYRVVLWIVALCTAAALIYGIVSNNLLASDTWTPAGMLRFQRFTGFFVAVFAVLALLLRRYIHALVAGAVFMITVIAMGATPVLSVVLLASSCAVLGRSIFGSVPWMLSFLGGLCTWALAIALTSGIKVHFAGVYIGIHAAVLLIRWRDSKQLVRDVQSIFRPLKNATPGTLLGLGSLLYAFLAQWILVWKPEVGGDALAMHLAIALDFANNHVYTFDYHQYIWALAPMGADFCYAAAAVLGGEFAARLLNLTMLGVVAGLIFGSARRWISPGASYLVAALFVSSPMAQMVTGSMFVENFTAALAIGAACALWSFYERPSRGKLCLCAFLLGSGIGWKLGGIAVAVALSPFVIYAVVHRRGAIAKRRAFVAIAAAALFLIPAVLPYARAYVLTGNPIFPYGNRYFTSPLITDNLVDYRYHERLTWHTLFDLTFHTSRYYEGQPGSFGFQYLFLAPVSLIALWRLRTFPERSFVLGGCIAATGVALAQPNARYFHPALPLVMVGGACALALFRSLDRKLYVLSIGILAALFGLNMWFLPTSNWYHRDFYLRPLFAERGRLEYLRDSAPVREVVPYLNRTNGGVFFVQNSDIAGVRPPTFSNNWHNLPFRKRVERSRTAADFYSVVQSSGIEHFVKQKTPTSEDIEASPAVFSFLDLCGEQELDTKHYVVLRTAANCERRLTHAGPNHSTRVFPPGKYDDDDPRLTYLGTWDFGRDYVEAYRSTVSYANEEAAEIRFQFNGSAFVYGYTTAPNRGSGEIWIDGKLVDVIRQNDPGIHWQSTKRYAVEAPGSHSVSVCVRRGGDHDIQRGFIDLDFIVVEP